MMDGGGRGFELSAGERLFVKKYYSTEKGNDPFSTTDVNAVIFPWNFKEKEEHGSGERKAKGKKKVVVLLPQKRVSFVKKNFIHARFVSFFVREWHVAWKNFQKFFYNSIFKMYLKYIYGIHSGDTSYRRINLESLFVNILFFFSIFWQSIRTVKIKTRD